jgi:hypothetical protein
MMTRSLLRARRTGLLIAALSLGCLASTCVVVEEGPYDVPYGEESNTYGEESNTQAMEEEETGEVVRESDL